MFQTIEAAPPDSILGLTDAFKKDPSPDKINLGAGVYKDDASQTPVLRAVKAAEERLLKEESTKVYLPIAGQPEYAHLVRGLLFGAEHPLVGADRAKTAYTPGGTGGLRVGADFLKSNLSAERVWLSSPTWANHRPVFTAAGFALAEYPYYRPATKDLDYAGMLRTLGGLGARDVVVLQPCCHNPTGVDLSMDQWREVAALAARRGWIPFLDFAYQGFGSSVEEDRAPLAVFAAAGADFLVASSFSKNMGLYRERTGALTLIASTAAAADAAYSQLKRTIRANYSNPAAHGALVAQMILEDAELRAQWRTELEEMRRRIAAVRAVFVAKLKSGGANGDFAHIADQRGMFSFSGLTDAQVDFLRREKSIYIVQGGRISVAGITTGNLDYLCASIVEALARAA
ncbi:MAG: amino acid aminotransferase [Elusimicrobiota bacterium]